jgi:curved DNA-binding protein CbpA
MSREHFIDYYEILQVSQNADSETIERVFRLLAKRYHPDNARTGDSGRFSEISEAFRVLSDPEERARYDAHYESGRKDQWSLFFEAPTSGVEEDRRIQMWILSYLFQTRRRNASDPGVGPFELEKHLDVAEAHLDYHLWYLKEKGWMIRTESGKYAISVDGVDWIAEHDQLFRKDRLIGSGGMEVSPEGQEQPADKGKIESFPRQRRDQPTQDSYEETG